MLSWAVLPFDFNVNLWFVNYRPWRLLICIFALPYMICAFVITKLPESPKFLYAQGKIQESLETLSYIYSVNTGNDPSEYPVSTYIQMCNKYILLWVWNSKMYIRMNVTSPASLVSSQTQLKNLTE